MTQDEIIRMAQEAGFWLDGENQSLPLWVVKQEELERFFNLAFAAGATHEREACAKVCEETNPRAYMCAAAIRARGETNGG